MTRRGRPRLTEEERERRSAICRTWANEIKRNSGLSARSLARDLGYGSGNDDADGRAWRALASGSRAPSLENFRRMTAQAAKNGWLDPLGWLRYSTYWSNGEAEPVCADPDPEPAWRIGTLSRTLLILMAHAQKCGVDQGRFFSDAHAEIQHMESFLAKLGENDIESCAKRIAPATVRRLLDGPEYPTTSLEGSPSLIFGGKSK